MNKCLGFSDRTRHCQGLLWHLVLQTPFKQKFITSTLLELLTTELNEVTLSKHFPHLVKKKRGNIILWLPPSLGASAFHLEPKTFHCHVYPLAVLDQFLHLRYCFPSYIAITSFSLIKLKKISSSLHTKHGMLQYTSVIPHHDSRKDCFHYSFMKYSFTNSTQNPP